MTDRRFLDSNIIVYAYDSSDLKKQACSQNIIRDGIRAESLVISSQVLGECYNVFTKKFRPQIPAADAEVILKALEVLDIYPISKQDSFHAMQLSQRFKISYWDALILSSAQAANCKVVLSEDLSASQDYDGIRVVNPYL